MRLSTTLTSKGSDRRRGTSSGIHIVLIVAVSLTIPACYSYPLDFIYNKLFVWESCPAQIFNDHFGYFIEKEVQPMKDFVKRNCSKYGYDMVVMPNLVGQDSQEDAYEGFSKFRELTSWGCSSELEFLLCLYYFPAHTKGDANVIPAAPTLDLCQRVRNDCVVILSHRGLSWPSQMDCRMLPTHSEYCESDGVFYPSISSIADLNLTQKPDIHPPPDQATRGSPDLSTPNGVVPTRPVNPGDLKRARVGVTEIRTTKISVTWIRSVPGNNSTDYGSSKCSTMRDRFRHDKVPPPSRDVIDMLGYNHTNSCCSECANTAKRITRLINKGNSPQWTWAFLGSMISANVTYRSSRPEFFLTVRIDHILQGSGEIQASVNREVLIRMDKDVREQCLCSRPDTISTNLFLGRTVRVGRRTEYHINASDIIWTMPENQQPLPKVYRKWAKLLATPRPRVARTDQIPDSVARLRITNRPPAGTVRSVVQMDDPEIQRTVPSHL